VAWVVEREDWRLIATLSCSIVAYTAIRAKKSSRCRICLRYHCVGATHCPRDFCRIRHKTAARFHNLAAARPAVSLPIIFLYLTVSRI